MAWRRRQEEVDPPLQKLLDQYVLTRVPPTIHEATRAIRCPRCGRTIVYDGRHAEPVSCHWCMWDLERAVREPR